MENSLTLQIIAAVFLFIGIGLILSIALAMYAFYESKAYKNTKER